MKESVASMEKIPSTMVLHKHVDWEDTIFSTMSLKLLNNLLVNFIGVIRRGSYQSSAEDRRCSYESVSGLWPDIYPDSDSSAYGSSDE